VIAAILATVIGLYRVPRVDVVELNTYGNGQRQVIVRQWQRLPVGSSHYVSDWRAIDKDEKPKVLRLGSGYAVSFDSHGTRYEVLTRSYRETITKQDPELAERKILPEDRRRKQLK
jgi:hypothetical protein